MYFIVLIYNILDQMMELQVTVIKKTIVTINHILLSQSMNNIIESIQLYIFVNENKYLLL